MSTSVINGDDTYYSPAPRGITVIGAMKNYSTYAEFISDTEKGAFAWVDDASGDPTVNSGGAMYRIRDDGSIEKIMEQEAMDQRLSFDVPWERLTEKPTSAVTDIDEAVTLRHSHENISVINLFGGTSDEATYNTYPVITTSNFGRYIGKYLEDIQGSASHVHANLSVLNEIDNLNDRQMYKGRPMAFLSDCTVQPIVAPIFFPATVSGTVEMDITSAGYFVFQGSDGYINLKFTNVDSAVAYSGSILVKAATKILWPVGLNDDNLFWSIDRMPADVSTVEDTSKGIIYDFRIIAGHVFLKYVGDSVNEDTED